MFLLFAVASIPMAFLGGYLKVDAHWFKIFAGIFLVLSGILLLARSWFKPSEKIRSPNLLLSLSCGAAIGLVSGLLGVGGGIFLSPLIIMLGYATVRNASGVAALFILCNSILALAGHVASLGHIPEEIIYWILAVTVGGWFGAHYGAKRFNNRIILILLSVVLVSAGLKFLLVG